MQNTFAPLISPRSVFLAAVIFALAFAFSTGHVWEDYYITCRSSKNLTTGNGFVFTPGERLCAYTSPLGTLLPALGYGLTLNSSDEAALWFFRMVSIGALAGAATLVYSSSRQLQHAGLASALLAAWLVVDAKSLDFTINGMEVGLLVFFLAYAIWSLFVSGKKRWLHLGLAWSGLMWTRPDGFIYIGALTAGLFLFNDPGRSGLSRVEWLKIHVRAGLVCAAAYLPWLAFMWDYYGSPIPHSVLAKAAHVGKIPLFDAMVTALKLPFTAWLGDTPLDAVFAPSYSVIGGWPNQMVVVGRVFASLAIDLWMLPFLRWEGRISSFAGWMVASYLACRPSWALCPWYVPGLTWLILITLGFALSQALRAMPGSWAVGNHTEPISRAGMACLGTAFCFLGFNGWLTFESARQLKAQQTFDNGVRRDTGLWLKQNAKRDEHVFLEPLGYIGFFSELKTYDFPGLSSDEVVQTAKTKGYGWISLISSLNPEWLVLRPFEVNGMAPSGVSFLKAHYKIMRVFDVGREVSLLDIYGRAFLCYDSTFIIFRRADLP
jgi:hypothetical protein